MAETEENLLGRLLLDAGLADRPRIQECLAEQERMRREGTAPLLGALLVEKGYLDEEDLRRILKQQADRAADGRPGSGEETAVPAPPSVRPSRPAMIARYGKLPLFLMIILSVGLTWVYVDLLAADRLVRRAERLYAAGRHDAAMALFNEAREERPDDPAILERIVSLGEESGCLEPAVSALARLLELRPGRAGEWNERLADLFVRRKDYPSAISRYTRALESCAAEKQNRGRIRRLRRARARALLWAKHYRSAAEAFEKLLAESPEDPDLLRSLAAARRGTGDIDTIIACYERLRAIRPDDREIARQLAHWYQGGRRFDRAAVVFRDLLEESPDDTDLLLGLARSYSWGGKKEKAVTAYRAALRAGGDSAAVRRELARVLVAADRASEAVPLLAALAEERPGDLSVAVDLAAACLESGEKERAAALVRDIAEREGLSADRLRQLADMELRAADAGEKVGLYRQWLDTHPDDREVIERFARLLRASGRHDEAWPLYRKLLEARHDDRHLLFEASEEASWAGHPAAALRLLEQLRAIRDNADNGNER